MTEERMMECTRSADGLIIALKGEIDVSRADEFYARAEEAYLAAPAPVAFECADLTFIDSTALGAFVKFYKLCAKDANAVTLRGAKKNIRKLFVICALDEIFRFED